MVRGEILRVRLGRDAHGHEQRWGVVVQADELLGLSTILISPTSTSAAPSTFRPIVQIRGTATRVLVDQTRALTLDRIGSSAGRLSSSELSDLDDALSLMFGL